MPRLGVGFRLSLALLALVTGALAIVYALVVPSLEDRLVAQRRSQLAQAAAALAPIYANETVTQDFAARAAETTNARALILREVVPAFAVVIADSSGTGRVIDAADDPLVRRAFATQDTARGVVVRGERRYIEVATPLLDADVLLLVAPLRDATNTAHFVGRRLLTAGLVALVAALALGFGAATLHARRIRRLQRAADDIAHGKFDEPVADRGSDELRELADAFERMRRRLAALDHARREFVANASHELRTPIFALAASLELLDDETMDDETRADFVKTAREQVARLTRLTDDLLDLSRLDAGRVPIEPQPVDLAATASMLVAEFGAAAHADAHELVAERNGEVRALGDPDHVLRVGRALVENALRHTPRGTRVRLRSQATGGLAVLEVEDDGPGIPPEHIEQIFDRFYRVDGTRAQGSGLGLAIARELTGLMGGELTVSSDGHRTRFALRLPSA